MKNKDIQRIREREKRTASASSRMGVLNLALLFSVAVIALTLVLTPMLAERGDTTKLAYQPDQLDSMSTGSITPEKEGSSRRYTIRRSILQETPGSVCVIEPGTNHNNC